MSGDKRQITKGNEEIHHYISKTIKNLTDNSDINNDNVISMINYTDVEQFASIYYSVFNSVFTNYNLINMKENVRGSRCKQICGMLRRFNGDVVTQSEQNNIIHNVVESITDESVKNIEVTRKLITSIIENKMNKLNVDKRHVTEVIEYIEFDLNLSLIHI